MIYFHLIQEFFNFLHNQDILLLFLNNQWIIQQLYNKFYPISQSQNPFLKWTGRMYNEMINSMCKYVVVACGYASLYFRECVNPQYRVFNKKEIILWLGECMGSCSWKSSFGKCWRNCNRYSWKNTWFFTWSEIGRELWNCCFNSWKAFYLY